MLLLKQIHKALERARSSMTVNCAGNCTNMTYKTMWSIGNNP